MRGASSFDHLVGAGEKRRRKIESDCLCRPKIHDQFELGRLFDRELSRFCSAQNFYSLPCQLPENFSEARTVSKQSAFLRCLRPLIDGRKA
jgi:hypothetical protein